MEDQLVRFLSDQGFTRAQFSTAVWHDRLHPSLKIDHLNSGFRDLEAEERARLKLAADVPAITFRRMNDRIFIAIVMSEASKTRGIKISSVKNVETIHVRREVEKFVEPLPDGTVERRAQQAMRKVARPFVDRGITKPLADK